MIRVRGGDLRGFTLVEFLVVLAIVGVLISIALPAVQLARDRARETVCRNNLRQLCLALTQIHQLRDEIPLPPAAGHAGGWSYEVLEFLEERPLHAAIGRARWLTQLPREAIHRPLSMSCPITTVEISSQPPLEASHFVLIPLNQRESWNLVDAPLSSNAAWLAGPETTRLALTSQVGPHHRGFFVGRSDGSVDRVDR